jgi:hypothetical protein
VNATAGASSSASGCVSVQPPVTPLVVGPSILGPETMGPCSTLRLDASASTGSGGRPLDFRWTVIPISANAIAAVADVIAALRPSASSPLLLLNDTSVLPPNSSWLFNVSVVNFLGASATTSAPLYVSSSPVPLVEFLGGARDDVRIDVAYTLRVRAAYSGCGSGGAGSWGLSYGWRLVSVDSDIALVSPGFVQPLGSIEGYVTRDPSVVRFPPWALQLGGVYVVEVSVTVHGTDVTVRGVQRDLDDEHASETLCRVFACSVLSCPVLSCPVLSCPVLSCPVLSCPDDRSRNSDNSPAGACCKYSRQRAILQRDRPNCFGCQRLCGL